LQVIAMTLIDAQLDLEEFKNIDMQKGTKILKVINSQVEYLSRTIDDFINFFDPKKEKEAFYLDKVILYAVELVNPSMKKSGISIVIEHIHKEGCISGHDCLWNSEFLGYPSELSQVLFNLFSNAKDILIENKIEKPSITVSCIPNGDFACVSVSDNGGGIPKKILSKVFEPYFTTKHKKQGAGIGLYMSRIIVEEHHQGMLAVANSSLGAVFTINLPIKKEVI
ncbi:MAG: HAMP domain-containing sensor histidine kinase, partial [Sulfurimonas sp.]|nr:HAMP domain-containing sensor histidine kinase [Sulfurimonas sp.]